jgi:UDP-glucose 4-epimerase
VVPVGSGPRRPGDPAVLFAASDKAKRELGWAPQLQDIDVIVETAWRWREAHPGGYGKGA